ncbi:hypothetical protein GCM10010885_20820 [Alicyclobacillus cellulosilyticus]|uniref:6-hydroxymethylpterin diphosphokinase MptE-like domain-containing protein n=1 Tax=Alicyclobacillus cellulosilyticus TaxID=1003997 RepID=A0A917KEL7_9BACL|nr:6-hydroxymethylpterin diphosphokinase MptE-like protein [Alicyclobacillus cellulosilyticus]GGJ11381.1 hypothetical protein GCM10010885_20820 [Alicyclobacillus cellulosilyticus]
MDEILQQNLAVLSKRFPKVAELVQNTPSSSERRVVWTESGTCVYQYLQDGRWRNLTSRYSPVREAEQQLSSVSLGNAKFVFLIGEAGFYHVEVALSRLQPEARLLFLSNRPDYLRVTLANRDLTHVLSDERLVFVVSPDVRVIQHGIQMIVTRDQYDIPPFAYWAHPVEERVQSEFVVEMWSFLHYVLDSVLVNLHTTHFFERWWARNFVCNIPVLLQAKSVSELEGSWRDRPVVIVGAGPSLNKNIDVLPCFHDRALIFCVDTAYRALERRGIDPHLVVTLDGSPMNAELMRGCEYSHVPLLIDAYSHFEISQNHKGAKLLSFGASAHQHWWRMIAPEASQTNQLSVGGSVATAAFSLARLIGADPVICVGLDLSYPEGKCYAEGTLHDQRNVDDLRADRELYEVEDIYGNKVYTTRDYLFYLRWFERQVKARDRTYVNATEGGALKEGWEIMTLAEALGKYARSPAPTREWVNSITSRIPALDTVARVYRNLKRSRRQLRAVRRYLAAMSTALSSYIGSLQSTETGDPATLERVHKAQRNLHRLPLALAFLDAISFNTVYVDIKLSDTVSKDVSDKEDREQKIIWANKSLMLFNQLRELAEESIDIHDQGIRIYEEEFREYLKEVYHEPAPSL